MVDKREVGRAISGVGIVGSLAALAYLGVKTIQIRPPQEEIPDGTKYVLTLEATTGGTTNPEPGTYIGDEPATIPVTAIVSSGYVFDGWYIAGVRVSTSLTYTVDVSENVLLIASFLEEGAPPLIPAYIKPAQNCVAEDWWETWITDDVLGQILHLYRDYVIAGYIKFKICDKAGNGVPDQSIAIYTESMPDITDYGWLRLNSEVHTRDNPLILKSDANGVVSPKVTYWWIEPSSNYQQTIGAGGKIETNSLFGVSCGWQYPIWEGWQALFPCSWIRQFVRVKHPILGTRNFVHAYWVDNPNLQVLGDCYVDCVVKIESDKTY